MSKQASELIPEPAPAPVTVPPGFTLIGYRLIGASGRYLSAYGYGHGETTIADVAMTYALQPHAQVAVDAIRIAGLGTYRVEPAIVPMTQLLADAEQRAVKREGVRYLLRYTGPVGRGMWMSAREAGGATDDATKATAFDTRALAEAAAHGRMAEVVPVTAAAIEIVARAQAAREGAHREAIELRVAVERQRAQIARLTAERDAAREACQEAEAARDHGRAIIARVGVERDNARADVERMTRGLRALLNPPT